MTIMLEIPKVINQKIRKAFDLIKAHFDNYPQLNENNKISTSLIDVDSSNRFVSDSEKSTWNGKNINIMSGDKVDSNYLPSYVDDVLEYSNLASFPVSGETGKIYIALDTNLSYRWTGSTYTLVGGDPSLFQLKSEKENTTLDNSSSKYPTNNLAKTYVDNAISAIQLTISNLGVAIGSLTSNKEDKSNKNIANGYMGLDSNAQYSLSKINTREIIYYNPLKHIKDRGTAAGSSEIFSSGASTGASFLLSNVLVMNVGDTIRLPRPILQISTTNANCAVYAQANTSLERIGSPLIQTREALVMGKTSGLTTDSSFFYGLHTGGVNQNTVGSSGDGLLIMRNPTINNGNWRIIKLVSGSPSLILNTSVAYSDYSLYKLKVVYNKSTEIAYFYIDDVLIHTENSVNLSSTLNYYSYWCYAQGANIDGTAKQFGIITFLEGVSGL